MYPETGATYSPLLFIVPVVVLFAVLFWIGITLMAERIRVRPKGREDGLAHRGGPVMGGVLQGSPVQRNRRDFAVTEADRRAAAVRAELERRREAELHAGRRPEARRPATSGRRSRPAERRRGRWFG